MNTKDNILKQIFFDENKNWESFIKLHPKNIREIVLEEVEKFRLCGNAVIQESIIPGNYVEIKRTWNPGDEIVIHFEISIKVEYWMKSQFGIRVPAIIVKRGLLTFALPVKEDWQRQVLNWKMDGEPDHLLTPGLPYNPMKLSEEETTVTLVPFGFTHLRMTYLPYMRNRIHY